jgi:DNA-directed RNA polymerase subunit M/transcription elongation factor TFIIS
MPSDVFTTMFSCPKCKQRGASLWETVGGEPSLILLSDGFYERVQKKRRSQFEIVCHKCGNILPPAANSPKDRL